MLENMFIGRPPGNYDRILDFSRPLTGCLFFVPSATFLDAVGDAAPASAPSSEPEPAGSSANSSAASGHGSLNIGSLKGETPHE